MPKTSETTTTTADASTASGPSELDLAFIIDATASMGSYIHSAQENMKNIIHDIITSEKCLLNVALILYRDHPPQDTSFIIQVHDFTDDSTEAKKRIDGASASGGGDGPEAVAPALHAAVHSLTWRKNAVKIALLIADAPPHGLDRSGDGFPDGDPSGYDPVECAAAMAENGVTLYTIGCEPAATSYRDFFMALAFKTGGQYIPLASCTQLAPIIVGSAKEEISLERLLAQVHEEVMQEAAARGGPVDEAELTRRIHEVMHGGGAKARRVKMDSKGGNDGIPPLTEAAEKLSKLNTLKEVQEQWKPSIGTGFLFGGGTGGIFGGVGGTVGLGLGRGKRPRSTVTRKRKATPAPSPARKKKAVAATVPAPKPTPTPTIKPLIKKKKVRPAVRGSRRSARLVLRSPESDEESNEVEEMETSEAPEPKRRTKAKPTPVTPTPAPVATKPAKMTKEVSHVDLADDELLDISQTRRLVRKCVARNKLKST